MPIPKTTDIFLPLLRLAADGADVRGIEAKIVLVDGKTLAELMMDHNVEVSAEVTGEPKRLDGDYFPPE